jgi:predicted nucleotidyltransferase
MSDTILDVQICEKRRVALQNELERWLPLIVEHIEPERIVLFGSLNQANVQEWSDIDLVIVQKTNKPFYKRIQDVFMLLKPKVGLDLLIYTPEEFMQLFRERKFVRREILEKGTILYERT